MKRLCFFLAALLVLQACSKSADMNVANTGNTGQGGSLARFTIARNHLYVVDNYRLHSYSLAGNGLPKLKSEVYIGRDIETIYSYEDKLFIGSQSAMYIYSIADPAQPALLGGAAHVRACDPVVANDSLAYVTVRSGSSCGGNVDALMIYDVRNVLNPVLRNTVPLEGPWGLGLRNKRLYVCDGKAGMVVYDLGDPVHPQVVQRLKSETYYDVIPASDLLIAMVEGGSALYRYDAGDSLMLVSKIMN